MNSLDFQLDIAVPTILVSDTNICPTLIRISTPLSNNAFKMVWNEQALYKHEHKQLHNFSDTRTKAWSQGGEELCLKCASG